MEVLHSGLCLEVIIYREELKGDARVEEAECVCIQTFNHYFKEAEDLCWLSPAYVIEWEWGVGEEVKRVAYE